MMDEAVLERARLWRKDVARLVELVRNHQESISGVKADLDEIDQLLGRLEGSRPGRS